MGTCSINQRSYNLKRVSYLYSYYAPYGHDVCVYCGDPAQSVDHVTPLSYVVSMGDFLPYNQSKLKHGLCTVPCCSDCNKILGGYVAFSVDTKRKELKRRLRKKYRRLVGSYEWGEDELNELGENLRSYIIAIEAKRRAIMNRIAFPRPWEATLLRQRGS